MQGIHAFDRTLNILVAFFGENGEGFWVIFLDVGNLVLLIIGHELDKVRSIKIDLLKHVVNILLDFERAQCHLDFRFIDVFLSIGFFLVDHPSLLGVVIFQDFAEAII